MEHDDKVSDAVTRVRAWLDEFKTLGGVDQEVLHKANHKELRASDLRLVLDALCRDR